MDILKLIGRENQLFTEDVINVESDLSKKIKESSFLVSRRSRFNRAISSERNF